MDLSKLLLQKLLIGLLVVCVWVCVHLLRCSIDTLTCSQSWTSLVSNGASAHWSGRQSSVLFAVWCTETSLCLAAVKTAAGRCYSLWKVGDRRPINSWEWIQGVCSPQVFDCCSYRWPCLEHVGEQRSSACVPKPACGVCTCMCMKQLDIAVIGSQLFCMWMSVVCTKMYRCLFLTVLLIVSLTMSWYGQWHAPCHLSHQACLKSLCMGSRLIGTCQNLNCEWSRWGTPASKFLRWSQQAKLCCFGFCRTVRVHSHWTCRPSLRHPRASHPTPPQLPHRSLLLLPPPSWAMPAPWSTASPPPASEDHRPESAQLVSGLNYPSHTHTPQEKFKDNPRLLKRLQWS